MTKRRSFESINYMLRPNKNVERKMIARTVLELAAAFPVRDYRYVGFGSLWFTDFILMHRQVGIADMVTIEKETSRSKRVEFNKPFACIEIKMQDASAALPEVLDRKRAIVWLDYDGYLENALTGDVETAIGQLASGSMLLVTVNAEVDQLRNRKIEGDEVSPSEFLASIADDPLLENETARLTPREFPALAARILLDRMVGATLDSRPGHEFVPLWSFEYADGAVMLTVGGMIVDADDRSRLGDLNLRERLNYLTAPQPFAISVPVLTDREKREFDRKLPCGTAITAADLPFELKQAEVDAYARFYLDYPVFNEIAH